MEFIARQKEEISILVALYIGLVNQAQIIQHFPNTVESSSLESHNRRNAILHLEWLFRVSRKPPTGDATCALPVGWFADLPPEQGVRRPLPSACLVAKVHHLNGCHKRCSGHSLEVQVGDLSNLISF